MDLKQNLDISNLRLIKGVSKVSWLRYGHHLLEGIVQIVGSKPNYVRSLSDKKGLDIVQISYPNDLEVLLSFSENLSLPIEANFYFDNESSKQFEFDDFVFSIRELMNSFIKVCISKKSCVYREEMIEIARIIIAGEISKERNGLKVSPKDFREFV